MNTSGSGRRASALSAAVIGMAALALTGCQSAVGQAVTTRDAPALRPAVIEQITPADRAAELIDRDRAARGFVDGCRQYVLIEHETWRVLCLDAGR